MLVLSELHKIPGVPQPLIFKSIYGKVTSIDRIGSLNGRIKKEFQEEAYLQLFIDPIKLLPFFLFK